MTSELQGAVGDGVGDGLADAGEGEPAGDGEEGCTGMGERPTSRGRSIGLRALGSSFRRSRTAFGSKPFGAADGDPAVPGEPAEDGDGVTDPDGSMGNFPCARNFCAWDLSLPPTRGRSASA